MQTLDKQFLMIGALLAAIAVAFGAFGAHGLQKISYDENLVKSFQTGVQYQFYHALAILVATILFAYFPIASIKWAIYLFIIGIILFSGSIYLLTLLKIQGSSATRIVGPITPIGGLAFIVGWLLIVIGLLKK